MSRTLNNSGASTSHNYAPAFLNDEGAVKVRRLQNDGVWREALLDRHRVGGTAHGQQALRSAESCSGPLQHQNTLCRQAGNNAGATTQTFCLRTCCRAGTTISETVASRNALPSSALVVANAVAAAAGAASPANSSNKAATARVLSLHMPKHYSGHVQPIYNGPVIKPYATRYAMR